MGTSLKNMQNKFPKLKEKKILIYGTGIIAKRLIQSLLDFNIIAVIDRIQFMGDIEGIPIKMWDEIQEGDADVIIIAALPRNYNEIYNRIIDKCIAYDMKIFGENGQNLVAKYGIITANKIDNEFFSKDENDLLRKIENHDAISFDLFDTLVMRKNLEPPDLFDLLEKKVKEKGILISDLKKYRRQAELLSDGNDLYKIYDILQKNLKLSKKEKDIILQEEIECEKQYIVPRKKMVEIMGYAVALGKRVNIITNMYLPSAILADILKEKGISGYEKLYVSCEYGVFKGNGLFEKYMEDVEAEAYLHIGDDQYEDVESANRYGLDAYGIKSAYEMLKATNLRRLLPYACNSNEKGMLGLLIAELFNNPFALYGSYGVVKISDLNMFGKLFVAPVIICYMLNLIKVVSQMPECDGILFGSRDCYLFKKLYDGLKADDLLEIPEKPSWYFMASRKLCLKSAMKTEGNIRILKKYRDECGTEEILTQIFGLKDIFKFDEEKYYDIDAYYLEHKEEIFKISDRSRKNYLRYMDKCGIFQQGKYVLCELISQGTVHYALNQIFDENIMGFYLCRRTGFAHFELNTYSCYQEMENNAEVIIDNNNFLESVLTSPEPSVIDMDVNGEPVFASEERTKEEIESVLSIQKGIESYFFEYINTMFIKEDEIPKQLPIALLEMHKKVLLADECNILENRKLLDDLGTKYYAI